MNTTQINTIVLNAINMSESVDLQGTQVSTPFGAITLELLDAFECGCLMNFYNRLYLEGDATAKESSVNEMVKVEAHIALLKQIAV